MIQVAVLANHENGRDSHIRQIKVFGPRPDAAACAGLGFPDGSQGFSTVEFSIFSAIR
jgi:anaphase-promoting complex subunit 10